MNKIVATLLLILIAQNAYSLRISKPLTLTYPITEEQISQLNKYLEEIWLIQNGRFELDVTTSEKSAAKNGEIWIFNDAGTYKLQTRAGGVVRSVTLTP